MAQMLVRRANGDGKVNMGHIWAVLAIERGKEFAKVSNGRGQRSSSRC
jgi:hypothetical protein